MSIQLEGLSDILKTLQDKVSQERIDDALTDACLIIERRAKELAPKGNGELRRSITSEVNGGEGVVYTPLEYAPYVEFGTGLFAEEGGRTDVPWCYKDDKGEWHTTSGMKPQPFMRPALDQCREDVFKIFGRVLKDG